MKSEGAGREAWRGQKGQRTLDVEGVGFLEVMGVSGGERAGVLPLSGDQEFCAIKCALKASLVQRVFLGGCLAQVLLVH